MTKIIELGIKDGGWQSRGVVVAAINGHHEEPLR